MKGFCKVLKRVWGTIFWCYTCVMFITIMQFIALATVIFRKRDMVQSIKPIKIIFQIWTYIFFPICGVFVFVHGKENCTKKQKYIITPNHTSFLDILACTPFIPLAFITIGKAEFAKIPVLGTIYKAGAVLVDRKQTSSRARSFLQLKEILTRGVSVAVYPEGTRNKTGKPLAPFQMGAFQLATSTGVPILPVVTRGMLDVMPRNFVWYGGAIHIYILPPVYPRENQSAQALRDIVWEKMDTSLRKVTRKKKV